jgi:hypothetical protein
MRRPRNDVQVLPPRLWCGWMLKAPGVALLTAATALDPAADGR